MADDPEDVTVFRFRMNDAHNCDMLEYQSEKAHISGNFMLAAAYAQAAGLYFIASMLARGVAAVDDS